MEIVTKEEFEERFDEFMKRILDGQIFIYPTDTVYGIGCDATNGKAVQKIRELTNIPIIAKEVGAGFNQESAIILEKLGFDGFDVGGAGGTSFAAIEAHRNFNFGDIYTRNPAEVFREWGIPTPVSVHNVRKVTKKLIIATGGLKTGIDIAKCISLGADIGGFAYKFLLSSWKDYKNNSNSNSVKEIQTLKNELRSCLWLMNLKNVNDLKSNINKRVIFGKLFQWLQFQK